MRDEPRSANFGDYLQALAFRVLHEDKVLQPRRASLYETGQPGLDEYPEPAQIEIAELLHPKPVAPAPIESGVGQLASPVAPAAPAPSPEATRITPGLAPLEHPNSPLVPRDAQPLSRADHTGGPAHGLSSTPAPPLTSIEIIRTAIARERERVIPEPSPPVESPMRFVERSVSPMLMPPAAKPEAIQKQQPESGSLKLPTGVAAPAAAPAPAARSRERAVAPQPSPPRRQVEVPPDQAQLVARAIPETRLGPLFPPAARALREETTVEITIGRLEIRAATTPPEAPRKHLPRQPEVSLKEYLSRHTGGRS